MISEIAKPNYGNDRLTHPPALSESCHTQAQKPSCSVAAGAPPSLYALCIIKIIKLIGFIQFFSFLNLFF